MKMVMMIVDADHAADIQQMFEECDVPGYTEITNVHGKGATGRKFGNRAFPGASTLYLAAMEDHCIEPLRERLATLRRTHGSEEGLKAFFMETEEII
jgi:nitrogen regulatory protein PII